MTEAEIANEAQELIAKYGGDRNQAENAAGAMTRAAKTAEELEYWPPIHDWLVRNRPTPRNERKRS